jgi:hypothetical protein
LKGQDELSPRILSLKPCDLKKVISKFEELKHALLVEPWQVCLNQTYILTPKPNETNHFEEEPMTSLLSSLSFSLNSGKLPFLLKPETGDDVPDRILDVMLENLGEFRNRTLEVRGLPNPIDLDVFGRSLEFDGGYGVSCTLGDKVREVKIAFGEQGHSEARGRNWIAENNNETCVVIVRKQVEAEWLLMTFIAEISPEKVIFEDEESGNDKDHHEK